jgi:hypothetical protein
MEEAEVSTSASHAEMPANAGVYGERPKSEEEIKMVPGTGLEPARCYSLEPESTNYQRLMRNHLDLNGLFSPASPTFWTHFDRFNLISRPAGYNMGYNVVLASPPSILRFHTAP